jgi:hypothetical protein
LLGNGQRGDDVSAGPATRQNGTHEVIVNFRLMVVDW